MRSIYSRVLIPMVALVLIAGSILTFGSRSTSPYMVANDTYVNPADPAEPKPQTAPEPATPDANASAVAKPSSQPAPAGAANCDNCWVHVFDDKGMDVTDDNFVICGSGKWPNLSNLRGATKLNWGDEIESIKVGPGVTVTVWTGENFTGTSHTFDAGTEIISLKQFVNLNDNISSIEIKCQ